MNRLTEFLVHRQLNQRKSVFDNLAQERSGHVSFKMNELGQINRHDVRKEITHLAKEEGDKGLLRGFSLAFLMQKDPYIENSFGLLFYEGKLPRNCWATQYAEWTQSPDKRWITANGRICLFDRPPQQDHLLSFFRDPNIDPKTIGAFESVPFYDREALEGDSSSHLTSLANSRHRSLRRLAAKGRQVRRDQINNGWGH